MTDFEFVNVVEADKKIDWDKARIIECMNILNTDVHGFEGGNLVLFPKDGNTIYGLDIVSTEKTARQKNYS